MGTLLLLSGPLAAGKSAIAQELIRTHKFVAIRSGSFLANTARRLGTSSDRAGLQALGDQLDQDTDYRWLIDQVASPTIEASPNVTRWLIDSVRKARQVEHFRAKYLRDILHTHIVAPETVLRERYEKRIAAGGEYLGNTPYDVAVRHPNEVSARSLSSIADIIIDVAETTPQETAAALLQRLERGSNASSRAD